MNGSNDVQGELGAVLQQLCHSFQELDLPIDSQRTATLASMVAADRPVKVVVVGEFNSGKSTLVNALCGWNILPVGVIPTTATINVLSHSSTERICVTRRDGSVADVPFSPEALQQFTARHGEQADIREVHIDAPNVPDGIVLIDTPGVNDINETRSEIVYGMIPEADALLFVLDIQQPLKKSEVDFLRDRILASSMVKTSFVLNHVDRVTNRAEIDDAVAYVRKNLCEIYGVVADSLASGGCKQLASQLRESAAEVPVFAISAKRMLRSSIVGQQIEGDLMGLRSEVFRYATLEAKMQTLMGGVVGQTAALIARLRREIKERESIDGAARESIVVKLNKDAEVLRKTHSACQKALQTVENRGRELRSEAERAIDALFADASAAIEARIASQGLEKGMQEVQQALGRKLESRMEDINQRVKALAAESARQASAFIPIPATKPRFDVDTTAGEEKGRDLLAELLRDPVTREWFMVLAPMAIWLLGWIGLAAVAFPFVARMFENSGAGSSSIAEFQRRVIQSGQEVKRQVSGALNVHLQEISATALDVLDEPQHRIRIGCEALCGGAPVSKIKLAALHARANEFDSRLGGVLTRLEFLKRPSSGRQREVERT